MSELFGPLPRHVITRVPLLLAVLAPLASAAVVAIAGRWLDGLPRLRDVARRVGARTASDLVVAAGAIVAAIVVATATASAAGSAPGLVVSPAWVLARAGSIDATLGFDADLGRGALALALALGGAIVAIRGDAAPSGSRAAWRALAIGAGISALLADGFATALLSLGGALVATGAGSIRGRWLPGGGAVVALLLSAVTLAWGLEGRWLEGLSGNYLSDYAPRFAAVRDEPPRAARPRGPSAGDKGSITMTSTPGADVFVGVADDASLRSRRGPLATSPFVAVPIAASLQKIAVVPGGAAIVGGDGLEIALCDNVDIRSGDDVVLTPLGASWTWRDVEAQLSLRDEGRQHPVRSVFAGKALGPARVPTLVLALAFAAALLALLDGPRRVARALTTTGRLEAALVAAVLGVAAVAPAARLSSLVPLAGVGALLGVAALLIAFGVLVATTRGPWLAGGVAVSAAAAGLVSVAADAPPFAALALAGGAALGAYLAQGDARRAPLGWVAGPDEDEPAASISNEPAPAAAAAAPGTPPPEASPPRPTKRKKKKDVEARS